MSKRKPYISKAPFSWWLKNLFYTKYMFREGSSVVIAVYSFILLTGLLRLSQGADAWQGWLSALTSPSAIIFHIITFVWAFYHTLTWFSLAPKASEIFIGESRLDDKFIIGGLWAGFVVVSLVTLLAVTLL